MSPWAFAGLMVLLLAGAWVYGLMYKPTEPGQDELENAPRYYTSANTEIGGRYPIVSTGFDGVKFSHQYFVVKDKLDEWIYVAVYEEGVGQGRPFMKGWVEKLSSQDSILPSQLKSSYRKG